MIDDGVQGVAWRGMAWQRRGRMTAWRLVQLPSALSFQVERAVSFFLSMKGLGQQAKQCHFAIFTSFLKNQPTR